MPRASAVDLRERSLRALTSGMPAVAVARLFDVRVSSLARWRTQQRATGTLRRGRSPGRPRAIPATQEPDRHAQVAAHPDATLVAHCAQWATTQGGVLSPSTMDRTLQRVGLPLKKRA